MEQARVERSIVLDASPDVAWSRLVGDFGGGSATAPLWSRLWEGV